MKVQQTLVPGNTKATTQLPNLYVPHRRLVCYCRLYEVYDVHRKERSGQHQREIFLFNDLLLVTKIYKKNVSNASCLYSYRSSHSLSGLSVILFEAPHYPFGIRLQRRMDEKVIITFNARNEHDRTRFVEDLKESVEEMNQMESIRIGMRAGNSSSGISFDCDAGQAGGAKGSPGHHGDGHGLNVPATGMAKSNSLLDLASPPPTHATNNNPPCAICTDKNGN